MARHEFEKPVKAVEIETKEALVTTVDGSYKLTLELLVTPEFVEEPFRLVAWWKYQNHNLLYYG